MAFAMEDLRDPADDMSVLREMFLERRYRERAEEARRVDAVIRGRRAQGWLHLALEVSWLIDRRDVEQAVRRAEILTKALGKTWPAVAGRELTEGAREAIERLHQEGRPIVAVQDEEAIWPPEPQGAIRD